MNIGFDFDGVILDSEERTKFYAEYYSWFELGKKRLRSNEVDQDKCFDWTPEESEKFYHTHFITATETAPFVAGAYEILSKLKSEGHKIFVISRRGVDGQFEIDHAMQKLKNLGIEFDGIYFKEINKLKKCEELKLQVFVDDNPDNVECFKDSNINVLFFKDIKIKTVSQKNVLQIDDWMDIYHFVNKIENKSKM